jgi:hypothetical protein
VLVVVAPTPRDRVASPPAAAASASTDNPTDHGPSPDDDAGTVVVVTGAAGAADAAAGSAVGPVVQVRFAVTLPVTARSPVCLFWMLAVPATWLSRMNVPNGPPYIAGVCETFWNVMNVRVAVKYAENVWPPSTPLTPIAGSPRPEGGTPGVESGASVVFRHRYSVTCAVLPSVLYVYRGGSTNVIVPLPTGAPARNVGVAAVVGATVGGAVVATPSFA